MDVGVSKLRDDEAFASYMAARGTHLIRLAYLLTGDRETANDLVQTVLTRAMTSWARIGKMDDVEAYLRRSLVNARTSSWRKNHREVPVGPNFLMDERPEVWPADPDLLELDVALRGLPYRQRAAVVLRYYEDLDDGQIAAVLDCAEATVRSLVFRALTTLRAQASILRNALPADRHLEEQ